jgi:hypothetical protein
MEMNSKKLPGNFKFCSFSVYNEDLDDEDDSGQDWNEVEDEEDDEIDSDGKKCHEILRKVSEILRKIFKLC